MKTRPVKRLIRALLLSSLIATSAIAPTHDAKAQTLLGEGINSGNEGRPGLGFFPDASVAFNPLLPPRRVYLTALDDPIHLLDLFDYFLNTWLPTFIMMTHEFTVVMMHQTAMIGAFFDAKTQMETQLVLQKMTASAHRTYQPDEQMCVFGTNTRSLAASDARSAANAAALSKALTDRQSSSAQDGERINDLNSRIEQMKVTFCDAADSGGEFTELCKKRSVPGATPAAIAGSKVAKPGQRQPDEDINFTRLINERYTLDIDFTDETMTEDELAVLGLLRNLFAHNTFKAIPAKYLSQKNMEDDAGDIRSVNAIRSVILNSFSHLIGMKVAGSKFASGVESGKFLEPLIRQLGAEDKDIREFLGTNPSYFAQMEVLTNKMYQNPAFYTALYARPENVKRMTTSMQAIKLMQDRDRYESALRREMLVSLLLELKIRARQETVTNHMMNGNDFYVTPITP